MKVEVNGVKFNCEVIDAAKGRPWIALSHALANNMTLWDDVVMALRQDYRILRYDQRGHGQTEAVPGPYTFPMLIEDAVQLMDACGVDKAHWIGLSIGGMIGYGLGIEHPARLRSLVACDSRPDAPPDYAAYFQSRIDKARAKGMDGVVDSTIERWFTPETVGRNPPVLNKVRTMIRTTNPLGHEGCCEALKTLSFGPRISEISVPTLVIGGAKDKGAPPEILAAAAAKIPGAKHAVVPDAGHIVALENPEGFMARLEESLGDVDGRQGS
ncbi:alpha/beta fold hydrolase [Bradyrhizobium vignae]|uniref:Alpha/beta hydrolase fold protein n=1 Tax=Bradyrhizobium vignae TaxID=1549949 RepID=A0A2U3PUU7_9BRAD|nr:alpha/beta fold hydrolase [Bradyrhizobium vignae]SPP92896.1 Alpha/beta hydrolase fold protein [Bradyrhizobium vignae]